MHRRRLGLLPINNPGCLVCRMRQGQAELYFLFDTLVLARVSDNLEGALVVGKIPVCIFEKLPQ